MPAAVEWLDAEGNRRCCTCKAFKPLTEFHKDKGAPQGVAYTCKVCAITRSKFHHNRRMKSDPAYKAAKDTAYVKFAHGISREEYEAIRDAQGSCAICGSTENIHKFHYDHNHTTGKYREFLCMNCNRGIGHMKENIKFLENAITYLRKHNES